MFFSTFMLYYRYYRLPTGGSRLQQNIPEAIERIRYMEALFDRLQAVFSEEDLQILLTYYEGGQWLADYRLDELGLLPPDLKRGVLSQDGVYNFLFEITENPD